MELLENPEYGSTLELRTIGLANYLNWVAM